MRNKILLALFMCMACKGFSQTSPNITSWLQNTTVYGRYYTAATGSTPITMSVLANCQEISYSSSWVYVKTRGIPTYPTGIFTGDGNTNLAGDQNAIYRFPLVPSVNTGTKTATTGGNCGIFINGVSLFDYRDGVKWNPSTNYICGGPGNPSCGTPPTTVYAWNRDAIPAEKLGFDCAKGHPAGTNYHHHQNPSPFKFDGTTSMSYSAICTTYDSDGLYILNSTQHSPLIGFAYDGYPIYGAYAYTNRNGTGVITRMKSSYALTTNTTRSGGPAIGATTSSGNASQTYFNGYFREDYVYTAKDSTTFPDYLDAHNGRWCVTPEYPNGTYAYFATINEDKSSAYPYVIGPTYYGNVTASKVTSITEPVTIYTAPLPLKFVSFIGELDKTTVLLNWKTNSEVNTSHFVIERSTNGVNFESIGTTNAIGSSLSTNNYVFTDTKATNSSKFYYRIKQVDKDGTYEYSKTIIIKANITDFEFRVSPNPASDLISVQYIGLLQEDTNISLYDVHGRLVKQAKIYKGQTLSLIDIQTLYSGTYIIKVENTTTSENFKIIVNK